MTDITTDLIVALGSHRDKLRTLEALAKTTTEAMQQILTIEIQAFDKRLDGWAGAAPLAKVISIYDGHVKPPY